MSEENVEIVRRWIGHFRETGDFLWDLYDPDVVFTMRRELGHSTYRGTDGMRQALESFREAWGGGLTVNLKQIIGAGDTLVLMLTFHLRGTNSGVELDVDEGWALWMRHGKFARIEQYGTKQEALEAAGLSE